MRQRDSRPQRRVGSVNPVHEVGRHAVGPDGWGLVVLPAEPYAGILALASSALAVQAVDGLRHTA